MQTTPLGQTGIEVSALCLGTMHFGWRIPTENAYRLLDQYLDAGGAFLDTANIYGRTDQTDAGRVGAISEQTLGQWMRERGNRDRLFLATKVGFYYADVTRGLRPEQIEQECEKSLQRLGVETIDLYYAHIDDRDTPLEETLAAFDRLIKAGKVRFIGASNYLAWRMEEAYQLSQTNDLASYCCIQQRHTYLRPRPGTSTDPQVVANDDLFDWCRARGVTPLAYSALLSGAYTRSDKPLRDIYVGPDSQARLAALQAVATEVEATPNQVVLAWMRQSDPPVLPLIAASTPAQLQENLDALAVALSPDQMERLNSAAG